MIPIVIDTNVFVSALRTTEATNSASRAVLRSALTGKYVPLFGNALWLKYEDLLGRPVWTAKHDAGRAPGRIEGAGREKKMGIDLLWLASQLA